MMALGDGREGPLRKLAGEVVEGAGGDGAGMDIEPDAGTIRHETLHLWRNVAGTYCRSDPRIRHAGGFSFLRPHIV